MNIFSQETTADSVKKNVSTTFEQRPGEIKILFLINLSQALNDTLKKSYRSKCHLLNHLNRCTLVNASEESVFCVFLLCTSFVRLHNFYNLKLTSLFIGSTQHCYQLVR